MTTKTASLLGQNLKLTTGRSVNLTLGDLSRALVQAKPGHVCFAVVPPATFALIERNDPSFLALAFDGTGDLPLKEREFLVLQMNEQLGLSPDKVDDIVRSSLIAHARPRH